MHGKQVLVAQKSLQQMEATQKVEAATVEARFEIERNELMAFKEKEGSENKRIRDNELKIRTMKQEIKDAFAQVQRNERLKRDPALSDQCAPGFMVYFAGSLEGALGIDDKKVIAKALKDQYCDLKDLSCLCDMKKRFKGRPLSSLGHVRSHLDCQCATKVKGRYKLPKNMDEVLASLGRHDLTSKKFKDALSESEAAVASGGPPAVGVSPTPLLSVPAAPPASV